VTPHFSAPSRRWAVLALAVVPILSLAACSSPSDDPYPVASSAVSSTCTILDKYFLNQSAPQSELDKVLKDAKKSGDPKLESDARAYQAAASALSRSGKNEAFAKMVGRCNAYGIGPNQTP
jgi:hypothetical protein